MPSSGRVTPNTVSANRVRSQAAQTVITFSEFPVSTPITTQYQPQGIIFGGSSPFIATDGANPTSPVLSGSPLFMGAISGQFVVPGSSTPSTVGTFSLDAGFFDLVGTTEISWFDASGAPIGSQLNATTGIETFSVTAPGIASWSIGMTSPDPLGFAIDNVSFGACNTMFDNPTGDPILDDPDIQEALLDAIQKSGAFDGTPKDQRLEEAGYIHMRASDGTLYGAPVLNPQSQTACGVTPGPPNPQDPMDTPVAIYHTHPHTPGSQGPSCLGTTYNPAATGGGSGGPTGDWANFVDPPGGVTLFTIDKQFVWRNDPGTPVTQRQNSPRHAWNPALCGL